MMQYRNAAFNAFGTIDVEINHPMHGWIPFTASPDDHEQFGREFYAELLLGEVAPYTPPQVSLEAVKTMKIATVEADKEARIVAGFTFGAPAVLYQSRPEDRENLAGASTAAIAAMMVGSQPGDLRWADPTKDFEWIAADNSKYPMDAQTMFALGQRAMAHKQAHIFAAFAMKRAIEDATTVEEVEAIDIAAGWPSSI